MRNILELITKLVLPSVI